MRGMKLALLVAFGLAAGTWCRSAAAQPENTKLAPEVKKLLDVGWPRSRTAREAAAEQYERLGKMAPKDRRVMYAYALVLLRQMRYREATVLLDKVLDGDHEAFAIRETRLWLLLMMKQYERAVAEMPELAKRLPNKELADDAEKPYAGAADFLGQVCGYLAGPAADQIAAPALAQCRDQILLRLTPKRRTAFEEAERRVKQEFSQSTEQTQADAAQAEAQAVDDKARKLSELEHEVGAAADAQAKEQTRVDDLRRKLSERMKEIADEQRQLAANLQQVEIAVVQLRREVNILDQRIGQLVAQAEQEEDPIRKQVFLNTASRWQVDRNRVVGVMAGREQQHLALRQRLASLAQSTALNQERFRQAGGRITQLEKDVKKAQAQRTRETAKSVSGQTASVRHQRRRSTALTTYVPMPVSLDAEVKRVLGWFE